MSKEVETIAQRLDWLFENHLKPNGERYTYRDIEAITAQQGYKVDVATIGRLRNGQLRQPGLLKVRAISRAFGLEDARLLYDPAYTVEDVQRAATLALLDDPAVREIAFHAATALTEEQRRAVLEMIRVMAPAREGREEEQSTGAASA